MYFYKKKYSGKMANIAIENDSETALQDIESQRFIVLVHLFF